MKKTYHSEAKNGFTACGKKFDTLTSAHAIGVNIVDCLDCLRAELKEYAPKKTFYALELTKPGAKVSRYALYAVGHDGKLEVIWPDPLPEGEKEGSKGARKLWPCQVFYKRPDNGRDRFPAYHFAVPHVGYTKLRYLEEQIGTIFNDKIEIMLISGWAPTSR